MAGLGFKDFAVGEVLTAADVDGYLMQQSVMRFADSAARGSALGTAVGTGVPLAEGMVAYLDDLNQVQVFDGASWAPASKVIQVVSAFSATDQTLTGSTYVTLTGCQPTITPSSATSKILLIYSAYLGTSTGGNAGMRVYRDATQIADQYEAGGRTAGESDMATIVFLDTPATTSAITYTIEGNTGNASQTFTWDTQSYTLLEVAG